MTSTTTTMPTSSGVLVASEVSVVEAMTGLEVVM